MVNQEILRIIEQISREKGIEKDILLAGVEAAVLSAAKRRYGPVETLQAHFNPQTGTLDLTIAKTVVVQLPQALDDTRIAVDPPDPAAAGRK